MITPGMNRQQRRAAARQKHRLGSAPSSNLVNLVSNPVWKALKTEPMAAKNQLNLNLDVHTAFEAIIKGSGTLDDVNTLAHAANMSLVLAERGHGPELIPNIIEAQEALMRVLQRVHNGKNVGFDAQGAEHMRDLLDTHTQQIAQAGEAETAQALLEINRRKVTNSMNLAA
jgi:hypothetical protein